MRARRIGVALFLLAFVGMGAMGAGNDEPKYLPNQKEFYLNEADMAFLQPGLNLTIQSVDVSGTTVTVTYKITDDNNQPLDRLGAETPGTVSTSWILARIKPGETQYTAYTTRVQTSPITGVAATQAGTDSPAGTYTSLGSGGYKYTFTTKLPADDPADATHTVGVYSTRDLRQIAETLGLTKLATTGRYFSNDTFNFTTSGKPVSDVRDVVSTAACNQCHDPLALHGGSRREARLCILCHQPQTTDPDTGNTVDFKVMIHKIHQGADLPSVEGGKPYIIYGNNQSLHDYSGVVWPQDTRNCTTCHKGGTQSDNYKTKPTRVACGSCHDDVNFVLGTNHAGGIQTDDNQCAICHAADTGLEFDLSVAGIHTIPAFSKQLKGLKVEITGVTNTAPGNKPTVTFTLKDNAGNPIALSALTSLTLRLAGPTTDYTWMASESAVTAATPTSTGYSFTFQNNASAIPAGAKGTYAVGAEAVRAVTLSGSLPFQSISTTEPAFNPLRYFSVDGSALANRREVVNVNTQCNVCHKRLVLHGGNRLDTSYCVMCHNPATVDNPNGARSAGFTVPEGEVPTSINFRFMIHRIHSGEELTRDYTVYRTRGVFNFNEIVFPGDRRNCAKCHVNNSHQLPLDSGMANTLAPRELYSPLGPAASACLGCHDSEDASAHAFLQTAVLPGGRAVESCAVCHQEGAEFSVTRAHAR